MQALSGRGARYIEKKARREVSKFVIWSRILRAVAAKNPMESGFFGLEMRKLGSSAVVAIKKPRF
jgi:hypothetical protein